MLNIPLPLRATLIAGSLLYLALILFLLRKKRLNIQYSIIWLASALVFLLFSCFPYIVAVVNTIFNIEMPVNLVFTLLFIFVLLLLLSTSCIVTGFAACIKRLVQAQALLEERVRRLEAQTGAEAGAPGEKTKGTGG
jgi:hypothetical protein